MLCRCTHVIAAPECSSACMGPPNSPFFLSYIRQGRLCRLRLYSVVSAARQVLIMPRVAKRKVSGDKKEANASRRPPSDGDEEDDGDEVIAVGEHRFRIRPMQSRRWRTFRTDRRMVRVAHAGQTAGAGGEPLSLSRTIYFLLKSLLDRVRRRHREAGRPENSFARLALSAAALDFPIVTDIAPLFDNRIISSLLASLDRAITSRQQIDLKEGFYLDAIVVDGPDKIRFFESAGADDGAEPAGETALWKKPLPSQWSLPHIFGRSCNYSAVSMPDFSRCSADHPYRETCLLAAVAFSMVFNGAMRSEKKAQHRWRALRRLNGKAARQRKKAVSTLVSTMDDMVEHYALDVEAWRRCRFANVAGDDDDGGDDDNYHSLRCELEKLQIRLIVTSDMTGYGPIFYHPSRGRTDHLELVTVLLLRLLPDKETSHAVSVMRPEKFGSFLKGIDPYCRFCLRTYSKANIYRHKCRGLDGHCRMCLRIKARCDTYQDRMVRKLCCSPPTTDEGFVTCPQCSTKCNNADCLRVHQKTTCAATRGDRWCHTCKRHKRNGAGAEGQHDCKLAFCRICKKDRPRQSHQCTMAKPTVQTYFSSLAFFDLETTVEAWGSETEEAAGELGQAHAHRINAVGLSFESATRPGVFSEMYFYDNDMHHEEDGVLREDCFSQVYWPPTMEYGKNNFVRATLPKHKQPRAEKLGGGEAEGGRTPERETFADDAAVEADSDEEEEEEDATLPASSTSPYDEGSAVDKFLAYILTPSFYGYTFLAHNAARFDSFLLIGRLVALGYAVDPIFDGNKLLQLSVKSLKLRFIDSWRYIMLPLSKFRQRFPDMELGPDGQSLAKGTFPYKFNLPQHYDYEGDLPARQYFVDPFSSAAAIEEYESMAKSWPAGRRWCFKKEMHAYLAQDVRLLRGGALCLLQELLRFQDNIFAESDCKAQKRHYYLHPFSPPYFSKSTFTHSLWQEFGMEEDTLTLLTNQKNARKTSAGEQEWLSFLNWKREASGEPLIRTGHSHPGGQACVEGYFPDGVDAPNRRLYEYAGCVVHFHAAEEGQCPLSGHLLPSHASPFASTCRQAHAQWEKKLQTLREAGYTITVMWECRFNALKTSSPELALYLRDHYYGQHRPRQRLATRQGLRGGRCESFRLLYAKEDAPSR